MGGGLARGTAGPRGGQGGNELPLPPQETHVPGREGGRRAESHPQIFIKGPRFADLQFWWTRSKPLSFKWHLARSSACHWRVSGNVWAEGRLLSKSSVEFPDLRVSPPLFFLTLYMSAAAVQGASFSVAMCVEAVRTSRILPTNCQLDA